MANLKARTKAGPEAAGRWDSHPSGAGKTRWNDGLDAVRCALLPTIVASRKRTEGDQGGVIAIFAATTATVSSGSKNPLGLCWCGDVTNLQLPQSAPADQILCASPWRLVKALPDPSWDKDVKHPLRLSAGKEANGRVWKWIPHVPGPGEFSVPRDSSEVDAILAACENRTPIPVFGQVRTQADEAAQQRSKALALKENGNTRFKVSDFPGAITAYSAALQVGELDDLTTAQIHANVAAALLKLGGEERAAKALKAALEANKICPTYVKAYFRAAQALEALGETEAAVEAQAKADELAAAEQREKEKQREALRVKQAERRAKQEAKEAAARAEREARLAAAEKRQTAEAEMNGKTSQENRRPAAPLNAPIPSSPPKTTISLTDTSDLPFGLGLPPAGLAPGPAPSTFPPSLTGGLGGGFAPGELTGFSPSSILSSTPGASTFTSGDDDFVIGGR